MSPAAGLFLVSSEGGSPCRYDIRHIEGSAADPHMTEAGFSTESCDGLVNAPQPRGASQENNSPPIQLGSGMTDHPVYRNGSLWITQEIAQEHARPASSAIQFVQVDVSNWPEVQVVQSMIIAQPGTWYFKPAITVNAQNDVAIVFACTDGEQPISICYTGRLGSDPLNTMRPDATMKAGISAPDSDLCHVGDRWGDFFGAALDPVDGSAWLVGQYANGNCWETWIGNLNWDIAP